MKRGRAGEALHIESLDPASGPAPAPFKYTRRARAKGAAASRSHGGWWIRLRVGLLNDPAVMLLPDSTFRRYVELQLVAAEQAARDGSLPGLQEVAWRLHVPEAQLEAELVQLQAIGQAERTTSSWTLPRFADEQDAESSAERVAAWRARHPAKRSGNGDANDPANGAVTNRYGEERRGESREETREETHTRVSSPSVRDDEQERLAYAEFQGARNPGAYAKALPANWRETAPAGWDSERSNHKPCPDCGAVLGHSPSCSMPEVTA